MTLQVIGFDLDNTLYDHREFIYGAYREISRFVSTKYHIDEQSYFQWILNRWDEKGSTYNHIFMESYREFQLPDFGDDLSIILHLYHQAKPSLKLYPDAQRVLEILHGKYRLVLITDGWEETQRYKIAQLQIGQYFELIYISGQFGKDYYKPSIGMFSLCLKQQQIKPEQMVYVGDHPVLDGEPTSTLGIHFVRLVKGENQHIISDHKYRIYELHQLEALINEMECGA